MFPQPTSQGPTSREVVGMSDRNTNATRSLYMGFLCVALFVLLAIGYVWGTALQSIAAIAFFLLTPVVSLCGFYFGVRGFSSERRARAIMGVLASFFALSVWLIAIVPATSLVRSGVELSTKGVDVDPGPTGRDARRVYEINQLQSALRAYFDANGVYPASLSLLAPLYLSEPLIDPLDASSYEYEQVGAGGGYRLGANLENQSHPALQSDSDAVFSSDITNTGSDATSCSGLHGRHCYDVSQ